VIRDELEYSISQYLDGMLGELEAAALEDRLANDAEARAVLAEYRELNDSLKRAMPLPAFDFDALAARISGAVADEEIPHRRMFIGTWRMPAAFAAAASLILAIGIAVKLYSPRKPVNVNATVATVPVVDVTGPKAEVAASAASVDVSINPAPAVADNNWRLAEDVIYRPSKVTWLADADKPRDNH
jgi:negative regulator of sigma E activity